jgi:NodT family efflux transporter outer membrane factor (OMF) lipoprotein
MSAPISRQRPAGRCGAAVLVCLLAGCAVGPDFVTPDAPKVTHYRNGADPAATVPAGGTAQHFSPGVQITAEWWRLFKSHQLDAVIKASLSRNPVLEAAQASLKGAQDNLRAGYGVFYPALGGEFSATREKLSPASLGGSGAGSIFDLFSLSGTVSYALDIWGGERREVEALGAGQDVQEATEKGTWLVLVSDIVDTVVAKAAYLAEIRATQELIDLQKQQVALGETQFRAGTVPYSGVLSIQSQLETYEATIPGLEQKVAQADDLLATLAGYTPAEWKPPTVGLADLSLPQDLPVSLPSILVRQRPDILAAEATAHGASAGIGVATAAMLPNVTLSGGYGTNSNTLGSLFAASGNVWSLGADVATPIIQGPTLWYKREAAIDTYKQTMALYRQTVLGAFQQVADTLQALDNDAQTLAAEDRAQETAREALHLVQTNYRAGTANYLDVLNADAQYHQAEFTELEALATRYQDTVALFTALGGGWWNLSPAKEAGAQ